MREKTSASRNEILKTYNIKKDCEMNSSENQPKENFVTRHKKIFQAVILFLLIFSFVGLMSTRLNYKMNTVRVIGDEEYADLYKLNYDIDTLKANGSVILDGNDVKDASAQYDQSSSTSTKENRLSFSYPVIVRGLKGMVITDSNGNRLFPRKGHITVSKVFKEITGLYDELLVQSGDAVAKGYPVYRKNGEDVAAEENGRLYSDGERTFIVASPVEYPVPAGSELYVSEGQVVAADEALITFDPFSEPIIAESAGVVEEMNDFVEDKSYRKIYNEAGDTDMIVVPSAQLGGFRPAILVRTDSGELNSYQIPGGAYMVVKERGERIETGDILAKVSKDSTTTKDIAGGLPQVDSLFEARHGKISSSNKVNPIILARVTGRVTSVQASSASNSGSMIVTITDAFGKAHPHKVYTKDALLLVREGDEVKAGEPLCDEPVTSREVLDVLGENAVLSFLVEEIQKVYRMQGVEINEKHLGIIIRQMLRKVEILRAGDTDFIKSQMRKQRRKARLLL